MPDYIRAIRAAIASEYDAIRLYEEIAEDAGTPDKVKKVMLSVAREEKVHAGEFLELLCNLSPDEAAAYAEGQKEVEGTK
jgi:rubrerythrin